MAESFGRSKNACERFFWALQGVNFNVYGIVSATGDLVERYEYTPYGQRTVYSRGWLRADLNGDGVVDDDDADFLGGYWDTSAASVADINGDGIVDVGDMGIVAGHSGDSVADDPLVMHSRLESFRTDSRQNYYDPPGGYGSLCDIGHQGLLHDKEFGPAATGLVHNRARTLNPNLGRFMQRDPGRRRFMRPYFLNVPGRTRHLQEYLDASPCGNIDPMGEDTVSSSVFRRSVLDGCIDKFLPRKWCGATQAATGVRTLLKKAAIVVAYYDGVIDPETANEASFVVPSMIGKPYFRFKKKHYPGIQATTVLHEIVHAIVYNFHSATGTSISDDHDEGVAYATEEMVAYAWEIGNIERRIRNGEDWDGVTRRWVMLWERMHGNIHEQIVAVGNKRRRTTAADWRRATRYTGVTISCSKIAKVLAYVFEFPIDCLPCPADLPAEMK